MYNSSFKHGAAEYNSWVQCTSAQVQALTGLEGDDVSMALEDQRFAQLVYSVNPSPTIISGDVIVDAVGIDGSGTVKLSGDQFKVFDQGVIDAIRVLGVIQNYATVVQTSGNYTWVLKALPGTAQSTSAWQAQQILVSGVVTSVTWADGSSAFSYAASDFASLSYF